jgi:pimeloyl-ACP methyl ester carboxylesterase
MEHIAELYAMRYLLLLLLGMLSFIGLLAQTPVKKVPKSKLPYVEKRLYINPKSGFVRGTQSFPRGKDTALVCLIIPGSGPIDRNGNNGNILHTDMYKMLSDSLATRGYAVIRYDKHGIGDSREIDFNEYALRFEDYVRDASAWIKDMKKNTNFSKVVVIGHSEGSLIGMLAADSSGADGFISIAGPAKSADTLILDQLKGQQLTIYEEAAKITERLKRGETVDTISPLLQAVYRPATQGYLTSWFKYRPASQIQLMKIPILIIQGTTDIQVNVAEGKALKAAKPEAELVLLNGMNHVLKTAPTDRGMNLATYFNNNIPLHAELVPSLVAFLQKIESIKK